MKEYTIKVSTIVDDYYHVRAVSLEEAYTMVIDLILNSDDIDIVNSISHIKEISCVDYDESDYFE